jgi:predicted RNA-binding protein with PUA-like domain
MAFWLFKQEPEAYSFSDLVRDERTTWDGVANALALKHLRAVKVGDRVLFYETGKVKAAVGEMLVVGAGETVTVEAVAALPRPVALAEIKADPAFKDWELVRMPRLSVMPAAEVLWKRVMEMSRLDG